MRARLSLALRLFAGYCEQREVNHPAVAEYLDHMWRFVGMDGTPEAFGEWEECDPTLFEAWLGREWPDGFAEYLAARGIPESEFRQALCSTTEVLHHSLYGAADERGSRKNLGELAALVAEHGVPFPELSPFAGSRWADRQGWGRIVTAEELASWRGPAKTERGSASE